MLVIKKMQIQDEGGTQSAYDETFDSSFDDSGTFAIRNSTLGAVRRD
jgi:hypothetical protein